MTRDAYVHRISIVIPVFQGEITLPSLIDEIRPLTDGFLTGLGYAARVEEVVLAYDRGPDDSARVIRELAQEFPWIKPVWLSRSACRVLIPRRSSASSSGI